MKYKLLLLDIDGTLRPGSCEQIPRENAAAVRAVAALPQPVAFVLWGGHAQKKAALAADSPYPRPVLQAPHPSPLSAYRGFFGSRPFSKINAFLEASGSRAIDWRL